MTHVVTYFFLTFFFTLSILFLFFLYFVGEKWVDGEWHDVSVMEAGKLHVKKWLAITGFCKANAW